MERPWKLWVGFGVALVLGALFAPWLYWFGRAMGDVLGSRLLLQTPFTRYMNRSIMLCGAVWVALVLWHRKAEAKDESWWQLLGLSGGLRAMPQLAEGVGAGLGLICAGAFGLYFFDAWHPVRSITFPILSKSLQTAVGVALLEELLFRGVLLAPIGHPGVDRRRMRTTALIFAVAHTLHAPPHAAIRNVSWLSGFEQLPGYIIFEDPIGLFVMIWGMLALGLMLGMRRLQDGHLYWSIGFHGAIVFGVTLLSKTLGATGLSSLWISDDLRFGIGPALLLTFAWLWMRRWSTLRG